MNKRLTEYNLNSNELEQLIDRYVTTIVDSMSMEDLVDKLTNNQVINEIKYTLDDEMLEEFITEIKNDSKD